LRKAPGIPLGEGYFGYLAAVLGHTVEARSAVRRVETRREQGYSPALPIAWTYVGLGETVAALDWLETALAEHDPFWGSPMEFPGYDAIRDQSTPPLQIKHLMTETDTATCKAECDIPPGLVKA
jgi:hypothetical protein